MPKKLVAVTLPVPLIDLLKQTARKRSVREKRDITSADLIREAVLAQHPLPPIGTGIKGAH